MTVGPMEAQLDAARARATASIAAETALPQPAHTVTDMGMEEFDTDLDPMDDTDGFNRMSAATVDAPAPTFQPPPMPMPEDTTVHLPCGIRGAAGLIREVEVRELTGVDEEYIARFRNMTPVDLTGKLVLQGLVRVGDETIDAAMLAGMTIGDRDTILLGVRRVTYGDDIRYDDVQCPECKAKFDLIVQCTEIPVHEVTRQTMLVPLRHGGQAVLRYPTHGDALEVMRDEISAAEQNTQLMALCLVEFKGRPLEDISFDRTRIVQSLGSMDRKNIMKALRDDVPGPRMLEVMGNCPACNHERPVLIDLLQPFLE